MDKTPFLLEPIPKKKPWGGKRLTPFSAAGAAGENIGELWLLSVRKNDDSVISSGYCAGMTLRERLEKSPDFQGSGFTGDFPLLIKLIDSADALSVQVHPDDVFAERFESESGKCEMWYVIDADPGSYIISGLREGISPREFFKKLQSGSSDGLFRIYKPKKGDVFFIPPGHVHSIGPGILLCEIQQNSDLTYRIYDYDRSCEGKKRELHIEKAKECLRAFTEEEIEKLRYSHGKKAGFVCRCDRFSAELLISSPHKETLITPEREKFAVLTVVRASGPVSLKCEDETLSLSFGSCVFIPAGAGVTRLSGDADILSVTV